ncbi:MAG: glycosyltransferase [Bacteroidetes bacterium]|nr:glycosyltransferase [Bacteroidota bacterium]
MSLTDKVIKNTYYYIFAQIAALIIPLVLTPYIIYKIGEQQFGIYAIVLGFTTSFGLFDLSLSSSFIKFISEHFNKENYTELNRTLNTGFLFYLLFSVIICSAGFVLNDTLLGLINIPDNLKVAGRNSLNIALLIFFVNNVFMIYGSVLIAVQKMYMTSLISTITAFINLALVFVFLTAGFGVEGILLSQLATSLINSIAILILAKKSVPSLKLTERSFSSKSFREMGKFGIQMQVSKLAGFFSEKYDEFLLGFFSVLNNVTFFNIGTRLLRLARFLPMQLIIQVAPVAAELNAKEEKEKIGMLFDDAVKYLTLVSVPFAAFMFAFADEIVAVWMGPGFGISAHILRILLAAQLINLIISSPGNSIIPNTGVPKYQMYEGLIHLGINVVFSFVFIKYYGIVGAAYGNGIATVLSSVYIFFVSVIYFRKKPSEVFVKDYLTPIIIGISVSGILYLLCRIFYVSGIAAEGRLNGLLLLTVLFVVFITAYVFIILSSGYLNERNKSVLSRMLSRFAPSSFKNQADPPYSEYAGEKVSIFVLTYNKSKLLERCLKSLSGTLDGVNYEILIFDNASTDGTKELTERFAAENAKVHLHRSSENLGNNAKSLAAEMCGGDYLIGVDDDIISFPEHWIQNMIAAYKSVPFMGYLVADVVQDDKTNGAKFGEENYNDVPYHGGKIIIQEGPAGGWCFMISRKVYNECGRLLKLNDRKFVFEDGDYQLRAHNRGFKTGILKGVKVYHATGEYFNSEFGNPHSGKYFDAVKKLPLSYVVIRKIKSITSLKGYIRKILTLSGKGRQ